MTTEHKSNSPPIVDITQENIPNPAILHMDKLATQEIEDPPIGSIRCKKCNELYALSHAGKYYCLRCDEHKDLLRLFYALKQSLDLEIEMRQYWESKKRFEDFVSCFQDIFAKMNAKIQQMEETVRQLTDRMNEINGGLNRDT